MRLQQDSQLASFSRDSMLAVLSAVTSNDFIFSIVFSERKCDLPKIKLLNYNNISNAVQASYTPGPVMKSCLFNKGRSIPNCDGGSNQK